jgi:hypothetical protein
MDFTRNPSIFRQLARQTSSSSPANNEYKALSGVKKEVDRLCDAASPKDKIHSHLIDELRATLSRISDKNVANEYKALSGVKKEVDRLCDAASPKDKIHSHLIDELGATLARISDKNVANEYKALSGVKKEVDRLCAAASPKDKIHSSQSASAIKIQRAWRNGAKLALVNLEVSDENAFSSSVTGYLTVVRARTEDGAEALAKKLSLDTIDRGYKGEAVISSGFQCWLHELQDNGWKPVFGFSGDTCGMGLSGGWW